MVTVGVIAIAGTAAVLSQAVSDGLNKEVSGASAYMWAGGRESFIGALSTAIFGPFNAVKALRGKMVLGGITNGFESIENAINKFKNMADNFSSRFGNKLAIEGIGDFNGSSPINNVKPKPTSTQIAYNKAMKEAADNNLLNNKSLNAIKNDIKWESGAVDDILKGR
ncbi:hypothetical protein [Clostridium sp. UBA6640]|uniref:hypothetical protein n=1 Tax=Clostridium sp. UBA6640 TaxID=1946370 RepID=UPI0025C20686|nr:hypothetical protein [Clostridium sp. UBA6640]